MTALLDIEAARRAPILRVCEQHGIRLEKQGSQYSALCPLHKEKTPSFSVDPERSLYHCFGCGEGGDVIKLAQRLSGLSFREAVEELTGGFVGADYPSAPRQTESVVAAERNAKAARNSALAREIWARRQELPDSIAESYLRSRGLEPPYPPTLAFLPDEFHQEGGERWPALLAAVAVGESRQVVAVHRTYLQRDGSGKAPVKPERKMMGPVMGGAVRLAAAGEELAITEGIETGLAVQQATGEPTWAALSAGGIRKIELPQLPLAREVIIAADHDEAGERAAEAAAKRAHGEGRVVRICKPPTAGKDFLDLLLNSEGTETCPKQMCAA